MGSLSLVKSGKLNYTFRFPLVFGSCNSKMLLVKSWNNMDLFWKIHDSLSSKSQERISIIIFLFFWLVSHDVTPDFFCYNSFDVKSIKFNRLHNRKTFLFHVSFKLVWLKREIKIFLLINYSWKKIFYNISGAIHSSNISEILILFEYFRNMYPCHRRFTKSKIIVLILLKNASAPLLHIYIKCLVI